MTNLPMPGSARLARAVLAVAAAALFVCVPSGAGASQAPAAAAPQAADDGGAEAVVRELYGHVTFSAGKNVDWEKVKALFIPEAVIVLRTSRTDMTVFDRDGFVADFVKFIGQAKLEDQAFEEVIVGMRTQESGDMARAIVHYAARIPAAGRSAQHGIDAFLLMKKEGAWRIVSVVNEVVRPGVAVPDDIK